MANSAALVGKVAQAREVPEKASFGGFLAVIRPIELDSTYLLYFLRAPSVQAALRATSSQTTNIANISLGGMRPMPVAVPPLAEQRRIVAKVDELMALCDELEQRQQERQHASGLLQQSALHHLLAAREPQTFAAAWQRVRDHFHILHDTPDAIPQLRQAILQLAVEGRLMTQDEKDKPASEMLESLRVHQSRFVKDRLAKPYTAPEITDKEKFVPSLPEGWQWARLKQLGYFCVGATPSMNKSDYWGDGVPWVTPKDMKSPRIKGSEMSVTKLALEETRLRMLPKKSVLIVGRSGILKRLLPVAVTDIECVVNQDMKVLVPFTPELGDYIRVMLCGFQTFILENLVKGGMTVQSLKYDEFEEQPFPLPPLAEQKRIVARVEELLWWCDTLEAQLRQTRTLGAHLLASTLHHLLAA
jgi:type I restriction enzyme S subunit